MRCLLHDQFSFAGRKNARPLRVKAIEVVGRESEQKDGRCAGGVRSTAYGNEGRGT
jgi:hypothetical protein